MILFGLLMLMTFMGFVAFQNIIPLLSLDKKLPAANQVSVKTHWTEKDEANERQRYLEAGESAFWLNPNRYRPDGGYDLLAEPYREQHKLESPKQSDNDCLSYYPTATSTQLGHWTYIDCGSTNTKTIYRM